MALFALSWFFVSSSPPSSGAACAIGAPALLSASPTAGCVASVAGVKVGSAKLFTLSPEGAMLALRIWLLRVFGGRRPAARMAAGDCIKCAGAKLVQEVVEEFLALSDPRAGALEWAGFFPHDNHLIPLKG
ncbi:hypothetical protein [Acidocella sp. MX-AZ02]|uniref:hypothetical protein n=1 Tax=Acidocella sp. MX-AZ02 TaxID=1214225 RepID=UPI001969C64C|nr:hypothetical protein [Acidocella sp. MX-AZ02]